jgi:hypothetical protein
MATDKLGDPMRPSKEQLLDPEYVNDARCGGLLQDIDCGDQRGERSRNSSRRRRTSSVPRSSADFSEGRFSLLQVSGLATMTTGLCACRSGRGVGRLTGTRRLSSDRMRCLFPFSCPWRPRASDLDITLMKYLSRGYVSRGYPSQHPLPSITQFYVDASCCVEQHDSRLPATEQWQHSTVQPCCLRKLRSLSACRACST